MYPSINPEALREIQPKDYVSFRLVNGEHASGVIQTMNPDRVLFADRYGGPLLEEIAAIEEHVRGPVRLISIQGQGYVFLFMTNASKAQLQSVMDELRQKPGGYSDDDLVPALVIHGFYARSARRTPLVDQIIEADW